VLAWAWDWLLWLAWYAVVTGGWLCWVRANRRAARMERERNMALKMRW
jgi:hypothetical protein